MNYYAACLFLLASGSEALSLLIFFDWQHYIGNPEAREVHLKFRKRFPTADRVNDNYGYIEWLDKYGSIKDFPYCQKLILELTNNLSTPKIEENGRIVEEIKIFYETVSKQRDGESILKALLWHANAAVPKYLFESGFAAADYSLDELIDMFPGTQNHRTYGQFAVDPEFWDFINEWPGIENHFSDYDRVVEIHQLLFKERKPANLIVDMLKMNIRKLKAFGELPIMTDGKIRASLLPLFTENPQWGVMPNAFERLSSYPEAIRCLALVQNSFKALKQTLMIFFHHHFAQNNCNAIINLKIHEKIGGWREKEYAQYSYFATDFVSLHYYVEWLMTIKDNNLRDRILLDTLWAQANMTIPRPSKASKAFKARESRIMQFIATEEEQSYIYQRFWSFYSWHIPDSLKDDELVPELEEKIWDKSFENNRAFANYKLSFLVYLLVPRLFPGQVSRIALLLELDRYRLDDDSCCVYTILEEYMLNGQVGMKKHIIESLQEVFEIKIDSSILDGLNFIDFKKFVIFAYKKIKKAAIQPIELGKFIGLAQKQQSDFQRRVILKEISYKINGDNIKKIARIALQELATSNYRNHAPPENLEEIKDVPEYLNSLYSRVDPAAFLRTIIEYYYRGQAREILLQNLGRISTLDSFGFDLMKDLASLNPTTEPQFWLTCRPY